ncbi:serine hydrolase domain-containing protein [Corallococcus carmarthensis]|uniref:serine hydrolase domain-containing protein n=1 Tax=Corallococcus carmarthensis TaxID=2316728 RepID=UPI00148DCAE1|nr:serine hydrolase domain-containing protein [Corallococcus carmarthensis]NOK17364.1 serine hydrolase [Corallococcus carmarthensis]
MKRLFVALCWVLAAGPAFAQAPAASEPKSVPASSEPAVAQKAEAAAKPEAVPSEPGAKPASPPESSAKVAPEPGTKASEFPPEVQRALDALVRADLKQGPTAGLSVGVMRGGQRWMSGYGYRDLAKKLPATVRTTYRMASITKSFTAVAVMQLAQAGKLDLDADIHTLVPEYPVKQWPVTVRQLLGHLGGVPTYDSPSAGNNTKPVTTKEAIGLFADRPLMSEPGTRYLYTTWGFNLLGAAVETASGQPYREYLRDHVFGPANMSHADLDEMSTRDAQQAVGYRVAGAALKPSRFLDVTSRFGGGGTRATVEDLLGFARAVLDHTLVTRETMGRMQATMVTRDGHITDYGMGFATYPLRGHYIVAHAGGQPETTTLLVLLPAEDTAIALATNVEDEAKRLRRLSIRLMETALDEGAPARGGHFTDPVDAVVYEGMGRLASYGLAYHDWATRGPGTLPAETDLAGAFTKVSSLFDRAAIARDGRGAMERIRGAHEPRGESLFIRVGAHMAATVERAMGAERLRSYRTQGAAGFFADYLAACETLKCPEAERFSPTVRSDVARFVAGWKRAEVPALKRSRLEAMKDPERLWPALKEAAVRAPAVRPDYTDELLTLADRAKRKPTDRMRWLERATELHPESMDAHLAQAVGLMEADREPEAIPHVREAFETPEGSLVLSPAGFLKRLLDTRSPKVARGLLRAAVTLHPDAPELWDALAKRERALGDAGAAKTALAQAKRARQVRAAQEARAPKSTGVVAPAGSAPAQDKAGSTSPSVPVDPESSPEP